MIALHEMIVGSSPNEKVAERITLALIDSFDRHYQLFRQCSAQAKARFEQSQWLGVRQVARDRKRFFILSHSPSNL